MQHGFDACVGQNPSQRHRVILVRMHPAGRHQPHQMTHPARRFQLGDEPDQRRQSGNRAICNRPANARQILHHHPPGTDIEVPDLGIAHLPWWQPDINARCAQQRVRIGRP